MDTEKQGPKNLMDGLFEEMNRVRGIIKEYEALPQGAGVPASMMMKASIQNAESAIKAGDIVAMLVAYGDLKEYEL